MGEDGANQESLCCRDRGVKWRGAGKECKKLGRSKLRRSRKAVVEKVEDGCVRGRDQPNKPTFNEKSTGMIRQNSPSIQMVMFSLI